MEFKIIDINTIVVDNITYIAVEHNNCNGCEFEGRLCLNSGVSCGGTTRPDHRNVIWKRKTTDIQNESSLEHIKPIDFKVVNENKIIIDGVKYQSTESVNGCAKCAFYGEICGEYGNEIPCTMIDRKDDRSVIWEKVPDKQIHVSLLETRQTKTYKLNFKP